MDKPRIAPSRRVPFAWEIDGEPTLLLGGSREDNLFQIADVEEHLDAIAEAGGNYVRCTMSSRDPGDAWPHERDEASGLYDLERPGGEYWDRFERFLRLTAERRIVLQIELWDRFDFSREPWLDNPFNPKNNVNYTSEESTLPERIDTHPGEKENPFFRSPPELEDLPELLRLQRLVVDRLLAATQSYDHVLYCMDNETNGDEEWASYWADYLRAYADRERPDRPLYLTEMWDPHDLDDPMHERTWRHPERYDFVDVSQGNHKQGQEHWDRVVSARKRLVDHDLVRPLTMVKIYGANTGYYGTNRDAIERFWRAVLAGVRAVRFHRPAAGLGFSEPSSACIRSARLLEEAVPVVELEPRLDLIERRSANEAYCAAHPDGPRVLFFCDGGDVDLAGPGGGASPAPHGDAARRVRWLDVLNARWAAETSVAPENGAASIRIVSPEPSGYWIALVE